MADYTINVLGSAGDLTTIQTFAGFYVSSPMVSSIVEVEDIHNVQSCDLLIIIPNPLKYTVKDYLEVIKKPKKILFMVLSDYEDFFIFYICNFYIKASVIYKPINKEELYDCFKFLHDKKRFLSQNAMKIMEDPELIKDFEFFSKLTIEQLNAIYYKVSGKSNAVIAELEKVSNTAINNRFNRISNKMQSALGKDLGSCTDSIKGFKTLIEICISRNSI